MGRRTPCRQGADLRRRGDRRSDGRRVLSRHRRRPRNLQDRQECGRPAGVVVQFAGNRIRDAHDRRGDCPYPEEEHGERGEAGFAGGRQWHTDAGHQGWKTDTDSRSYRTRYGRRASSGRETLPCYGPPNRRWAWTGGRTSEAGYRIRAGARTIGEGACQAEGGRGRRANKDRSCHAGRINPFHTHEHGTTEVTTCRANWSRRGTSSKPSRTSSIRSSWRWVTAETFPKSPACRAPTRRKPMPSGS